MLRGQSLWTALVFNPFQCHTPCTDDLAEGFAGFKSSLATDGKDVPSEWMCSAIPFLNSLQSICKGRQHFFLPLPVLLNLVSHLLWFIIAHKSGGIFAQPAGKMHAGFACLSFPQPHGAALQSCGEVWWLAGWELRGHEEISFPAQDPSLAPACPCHGTSLCWVTHQHSADEQWVAMGAAASCKEDMRNLCPHLQQSCSGGKSSQFMG